MRARRDVAAAAQVRAAWDEAPVVLTSVAQKAA